MRTIQIDDDTYRDLERQAAEHGLSVEAWLHAQLAKVMETAAGNGSHAAPVPFAALSIPERLARLDELDAHAGRFGGRADASREHIYE